MPPWAAWALVGARLLGAALIAVAPFANGRMSRRRTALLAVGVGVVAVLAATGFATSRWGPGRRSRSWRARRSSLPRRCSQLCGSSRWSGSGFAITGTGETSMRGSAWRRLSRSSPISISLLTPIVSSDHVLQGDFLRVVAFGFLLVGVWRAVADAEFGRAVADERARVAREIHDGLAQYLFAISTQVSMLESDAPLEQVLPRLKQASTAAQQEARFAVLALSSAGGSARFDSALRRYIDVLTADGDLDVELEVDRQVRLAPDEQIEVFRIVQEGLGNVRRHAGARHVDVSIAQRGGRRVVSVSDDGVGFDEDDNRGGPGPRQHQAPCGGDRGRTQPAVGSGAWDRYRGRAPTDLASPVSRCERTDERARRASAARAFGRHASGGTRPFSASGTTPQPPWRSRRLRRRRVPPAAREAQALARDRSRAQALACRCQIVFGAAVLGRGGSDHGASDLRQRPDVEAAEDRDHRRHRPVRGRRRRDRRATGCERAHRRRLPVPSLKGPATS